jgi:hypothetical protein
MKTMLGSMALVLIALPLVACGSSRDVEVSGQVSAPATVTVQGPIALQFYDLVDAENPEKVHSISLETPRAFNEKVALEGDKVRIVAIDDRDNNGACSAGESWAQVEAPIKDDDSIDPVTLTLALSPCPN